jgi:iron complex transport system substrate-binding protein
MFARKIKASSLALLLITSLLVSVFQVSSVTASTKYPLKIKSAGYTTKLSAKPIRIISLSPSATEILFAIKAGSQVFAVDDNSNFPLDVPKSELSSFTPNVEAIAALKPDLVVLQINATNARNVRDALTKLKIPVFVEPAARNLNDTYSEIALLGRAVDQNPAADTLVKNMKKRIAKTLASVKTSRKISFFHELDNTLYTATSKTFIGRVYKDFGLVNIADAASKADDAGYPQLSAEYLIKSNPEMIFLANAQYGETAVAVSARPGWQGIKAVRNQDIIELPADIPSRWGPRIVDFYELVAEAISNL